MVAMDCEETSIVVYQETEPNWTVTIYLTCPSVRQQPAEGMPVFLVPCIILVSRLKFVNFGFNFISATSFVVIFILSTTFAKFSACLRREFL